ncbi:hypothetical protein Y032_0219g2442 [Ancylostoma ceylanicum]|uniref:Uncharacterized protein n=1 Tax=Ancylostoma ceylanicum TaxID=53326 RepID=A0A016SIK5_9BILA|nr:hypothetical protein Y032_0219g2442 [Ancylostoma ceylanicum]
MACHFSTPTNFRQLSSESAPCLLLLAVFGNHGIPLKLNDVVGTAREKCNISSILTREVHKANPGDRNGTSTFGSVVWDDVNVCISFLPNAPDALRRTRQRQRYCTATGVHVMLGLMKR